MLGFIGNSYYYIGDMAQAEAAYRQAASDMNPQHIGCVMPMANLVELCAEDGRLEEAKTFLRDCRELIPESAEPSGYHGTVLRATACTLAAEGDIEAADRTFAESLQQLAHHGYLGRSRTLEAWGRWLLRAGGRTRADEKFDELADLYRSVGVGQRWFDRLEEIRRGN